jgi:hypothetical protein
MALRIDLDILNQKGTPAFYSDTFANRPNFGYAGRVFISTDTGAIYEDTGTAWTLIADAGAGTTGTLEQVTTNGNTTTKGITITANGLSANSITNTSLTTGSVAFVGAAGLMTQDNANFFWDDTNNRLGIGTASPGTKLDIHGTGAIASFNGTTTNNGYIAFQNAGVTKWTMGNQYAGGTNVFAINNSSGTAIFGITGGTQANFQYSLVSYGTFSAFNVGDQIRVAGGAIDARIGTNSGDNLMFIGATSTSYGLNIDLSTGSLAVTNKVTATQFVLSGATSPSGLYYSAAENRVTVANYTSAGKVVIETNGGTTAATFNANQTTNFASNVGINSPTINSISNYGGLSINGTNGAFTYWNINGVDTGRIITDSASMYFDNLSTGALVFRTTASSSERVRINSVGSINFGYDNSASNKYMQIVPNNAATATPAYLQGVNAGTGAYAIAMQLSGGNVLIGTATDTGIGLLQVRDNAIEVINSYYWLFNTGNSSRYGFLNNGAGALVLNLYGTGNVGSFNMATGVYTPLSDINKKKDFENSTIGLNSILNLKPTLYRMKTENNTEKHLGFIAQEVKEFIPQAYVETKDLIGLDYNPIVAALVKSIQELNEKLVRNNIN